jgi:hypothetical protein
VGEAMVSDDRIQELIINSYQILVLTWTPCHRHDLLMEVWKGHTTHTGLIQHPLMSFTQGITFEESRAAGCNWEFALPAAEVAEYITQVSSPSLSCELFPLPKNLIRSSAGFA